MTGYDKNDNVLSSQCYGQTSASVYALIILTGNLLNHVDDTATTSAYNNGFEFKDGVKQANEYVYDANGNLTKDLNKGISNITYNVLNLPTGVTFASGGLEPDLTILLDGDPDLLAARRALRGVEDRYENAGLEFQKKVRDGFMLLAEKYPERIFKINALQDEQKVTAEIMRVINTTIKI